jgi:hypothetical protein
VVNDGALVDFYNLQMMDYVLCHFIPLEHHLKNLTYGKNKGHVSYIKEHNINVLKNECCS